MEIMQDIDAVVSVLLALWGLIALVMGPVALVKARKYFPERREAITPDQLRAELAAFDKNLREAVNSEVGRLRLSVDENHRELLSAVRDATARAEAARELAGVAKHKADLVEERVNGLDRLVLDKMKNIEEALSQLRQQRRGDHA